VAVALVLDRLKQQSFPSHGAPPFCRCHGGSGGTKNPGRGCDPLSGFFFTARDTGAPIK